MQNTIWNIPGRIAPEPELLRAGLSPLLAALLTGRGLTDPEKALSFLGLRPQQPKDPFLLKDMDCAVERIQKALQNGEKIAVYGDYDVDGLTSVSLLTDYLRSKGANCVTYIPSRLHEGYGVSSIGIDALNAQGVRLIVTVDCGITALAEARYASSLGIDMVITDHHECPETLPEAVAVVNPRRPDCSSGMGYLAGVGVAFKLVCALEGGSETVFRLYSDLAALGTIADVMPMEGENRLFIRSGLKKLSESPREGLRALIRDTDLTGKAITAINVGFTLAPRINAAGRLGRTGTALDLLLAQTAQEAEEASGLLCSYNRERQQIESEIFESALSMLAEQDTSKPIVLSSGQWHQGVAGIVASRLTERYHQAVILICLDGDFGKGSCRSWGGFNLFDALCSCADTLDGFGGHAQAAGLTIRRENIGAFRRKLDAYAQSHPVSREKEISVDLCIDDPALLSLSQVSDLELLEPCGRDNPIPQLCLSAARIENMASIGGGRHTRLRLRKFGQSWDAVYFGAATESLYSQEGLRNGAWVDMVFQAQINEFRGQRSVEPVIQALRLHDFQEAVRALSGEIPRLPATLRPERSDFVRLWKGLARCGGTYRAPLPVALEELMSGTRDIVSCVCMKVFEEMGLVNLSFQDNILYLSANKPTKKVNLEESQILAML